MEDQFTSTTAWHDPYGSLDEAMEKCVLIAMEKGLYPRTAECYKSFFYLFWCVRFSLNVFAVCERSLLANIYIL